LIIGPIWRKEKHQPEKAVANWTLSGTAKIKTMSEEFSWQDNEAVIIKRTDAIAVYTNHDGDIVIRQEGMGLATIRTIRLLLFPASGRRM
jgi:hypothetical protein